MALPPGVEGIEPKKLLRNAQSDPVNIDTTGHGTTINNGPIEGIEPWWTDPTHKPSTGDLVEDLPAPPGPNISGMEGIGQGFLTPFDRNLAQRTRDLGQGLERFAGNWGIPTADIFSRMSGLPQSVREAVDFAKTNPTTAVYDPKTMQYKHQTFAGKFNLRAGGQRFNSFGEVARYLIENGYVGSDSMRQLTDLMRSATNRGGGY